MVKKKRNKRNVDANNKSRDKGTTKQKTDVY